MAPIIFVFGKSGSGKTTFAEAASQSGEIPEPSDRLKLIIGDLFQISDDTLWGPASARNELDQRFTDHGYRTQCSERFEANYRQICYALFGRLWCRQRNWSLVPSDAEAKCREWFDIVMRKARDPKSWGLTPRYLLQSFGTEFAQSIELGVWNRHLMGDVLKLQLGGWGYSEHSIVEMPGTPAKPMVCISGGRFLHDAAAAEIMKAVAVLVERPELDQTAVNAAGIRNHSSETELDRIPREFFHYIISNNSDLEALRECARSVAQEILREPK